MTDYKKEFLDRMEKAFHWATVRGAKVNKAVCFAQAALESDWGRSVLAQKYNNLFGIKAGSWTGKIVTLTTVEYVKNNAIECKARFRWYESWQLCIVDYYNVIANRKWFQEAINHVNDADVFLLCLLPLGNKPGWATDPDYFRKVKRTGAEIEKLGGPAWK